MNKKLLTGKGRVTFDLIDLEQKQRLLIECAQNIISTRFRPNHRHALLIWIWLI
jgi:hypothetical protein